MVLIKKFEADPDCNRLLSFTTLVLIPKKENVADIRDHRPISHLNCSYKINKKVLSNRLNNYIDKLTITAQSTFILGRYILYNFMMAHECLYDQKFIGKYCILLKLDFEGAYDRIKRYSLLRSMQLLGFSNKWIRWIKSCISTTKFWILVADFDFFLHPLEVSDKAIWFLLNCLFL